MTLKTKLEAVFGDDERAVSPVIGVILMVAITVILAAVIATFVTDLGGNTQANPQAGVTFEQNTNTVTVQLNNIQRADSFTVEWTGGTVTNPGGLSNVGDTVDVSGVSSGEKITVTATYSGNTAVIGSYTVP